MRKTSYLVALAAVTGILLLTILAVQRPDWLVVQYEEILYTKVTVTYGLAQRCELTLSSIPDPSDNGTISYRKYECRKFPESVTDHCDKENRVFCAAWTSAFYFNQLSIGFEAISLVAILFGVSTHSRRTRIWRAVAGLVLLQATCQIIAFGVVTEMYRTSGYPSFERARPGLAYVLQALSWIFSIIVTFGVFATGISANAGHRWAAGNRAYQSIPP